MRVNNTFVKPSKIHGLGLFANKDILKGERIRQGGANFDYRKEWIEYVKRRKVRSFTFNNGYCMVNHSDSPNTKRSGKMKIIATANIRRGAEITEDYNILPEKENPMNGISLEEMIYRAQL